MTFTKKIVYSSVAIMMLGLALTLYVAPPQAMASAISTLSGRDLSLGDRGSDVTDLQGLLGEQGYLVMPVGVPFGYFGPITKAALTNYQASIGVPATGYYGPLTRMSMVKIFTDRGWLRLLASAPN